MTRTFTVPILLPADPVNALEAATKQYVDTSAGGVSNYVSYTYNATTTAPPASAGVRLNNATLNSATTMWVHQVTSDGTDVTLGLSRITAGYQIYMQTLANSANWRLYNVTSEPTDSGAYWTIPIAYSSGGGTIVAGAVVVQAISPAQVGLPRGGDDGDVLTKTSASDYAVDWTEPFTQVDADDRYMPVERAVETNPPLTGGGALGVGDLTLSVNLFSDTSDGIVTTPGTYTGKVLVDTNEWRQLIIAVDDGDWPPASPDANTLYLHLAP